MKKEILINHTLEETRIVLLEDGYLAEFFIDRSPLHQTVQGRPVGEGKLKKIIGNVYLGKVVNIVPNLQSAFVNIGLKKNAYLPLDETLPRDGKNSIEGRLRKGGEVIVQVVKEPIGTKGAKVSEKISLPGRYLVYMPLERRKIFLSRQIEEKKERERLKKVVQSAIGGSLLGGGLIIRTEAEGKEKEHLFTDFEYLSHLWDNIQIKRKEKTAPVLLYEEVSIVYQVLRDLFSEEVAVVLIDSLPFYKDILNYIQIISPYLKSRVQYYSAKTPIFTAYKLEEEIKRIYQPKVKLPSGGYIIIQETESLCAIDVNTGKFRGKNIPQGASSLENTALQTNLEAAKEIAREMRLRNIGGIIVIDFISLRKESNRRKVYNTLFEALKNDKAKIEILSFNRFGLVELTRERKRESTLNLLTEECPECFGSGRIISQETLYLKIKKELSDLKNTLVSGKLRLRVHPNLLKYLQTHQEELKNIIGGEIELVSDLSLKHDEYQIILH